MSDGIERHTVPLRCGILCRILDDFLTWKDAHAPHIFACFFNCKEGLVYSRTAGYSWMRISPIKVISTVCSSSLSHRIP